MRTTVSLGDDLVAPAPELTGLKETSTLIREALMGRVARASAGRLILLGGSQPDAAYIPRRRPKKVSG